MIKALKRQLWVLGDEILTGYIVILGGYLFGILLMQITMHMDKSVESYFPLGTLIGGMVFCFYASITGAVGFRQYFNLEISMCCTRNNFFLSYLIVNLLNDLLGVLLVLALGKAEEMLYALIHPQMIMDKEIDFLYYIGKYGVPAAIILSVVGIFCGIMLLRFGQKAFWVLWAIWMLACLGGPRIHDAVTEAPNSLLGRLGMTMFRFICMVPGKVWAVLGVILCAVCLLISYLIVRKQQVN